MFSKLTSKLTFLLMVSALLTSGCRSSATNVPVAVRSTAQPALNQTLTFTALPAATTPAPTPTTTPEPLAVRVNGEGISIALGYGALAAREIGKAFQRNEFSFQGYKRRVASSSLGRALLVRWLLAQFVYAFKWKWFQVFAWRIIKPMTTLIAKVLVLNWGKRL